MTYSRPGTFSLDHRPLEAALHKASEPGADHRTTATPRYAHRMDDLVERGGGTREQQRPRAKAAALDAGCG